MDQFLFVDAYRSALAAGIDDSQTTITVDSASGLPTSIPAGYKLVLTLHADDTPSVQEQLNCTGISGTTLTVGRGANGTSAASWPLGTVVGAYLVAEVMDYIVFRLLRESSFARLVSGQTISGQTLTKVIWDTIVEGTFVDGDCILGSPGVYIASAMVVIDMDVEQHESQLKIFVDNENTPILYAEIDSKVNHDDGTVTLQGVISFGYMADPGHDAISMYVYVDTTSNRTIQSGWISVERIA